MSKEAREKRPAASPAVMEKMKELAELISQEQFAPSGVPIEITFSEIEEIGHQAGQLIAGASRSPTRDQAPGPFCR